MSRSRKKLDARASKLLTVLLHNAEELDDDLGGGSEEDLSLSSLLGIDD